MSELVVPEVCLTVERYGFTFNTALEEWRPVLGYEGAYEVSNQIQVRSLDRWVERRNHSPQYRQGVVLSTVLNDGYLQVALSIKVRRKIHILVCEAWHGPKPTLAHEVAHFPDKNRLNATPENLRWATRQENMTDQLRHHQRHGAANLYVEDILRIRQLRRDGMKVQAIADLIGISGGLVSMICNKKRWGHVPD